MLSPWEAPSPPSARNGCERVNPSHMPPPWCIGYVVFHRSPRRIPGVVPPENFECRWLIEWLTPVRKDRFPDTTLSNGFKLGDEVCLPGATPSLACVCVWVYYTTSSLTINRPRCCAHTPPSVSQTILIRAVVRYANYANYTSRSEVIIDLTLALGLSWLYLSSWSSRSNPCRRPISLAPTLHRKQGHASKTKIDGIRKLRGWLRSESM